MEKILDNSNIKISDDVLCTIATIAVTEIDGVYSMGGSFTGDIVEKLGKKNLTKGAKVTIEDNNVTLDLNVILKYGVRIPDVAYKIQDNVKTSVESMTGLNVCKVNVRIVGVEVEKEPKSTAKKSLDKKGASSSESDN